MTGGEHFIEVLMKRLFLVLAVSGLFTSVAFARRNGDLDHGRESRADINQNIAKYQKVISGVEVEALANQVLAEYESGRFSPDTVKKIEAALNLAAAYKARVNAVEAGLAVSALQEILNLVRGEPSGLDLPEKVIRLKQEAERYKQQRIEVKDRQWEETRQRELNDPGFVGPPRGPARPRDEEDNRAVSLDDIATGKTRL
jgi:hypothetical protein